MVALALKASQVVPAIGHPPIGCAVARSLIEAEIEATLDRVAQLLALLDEADGDPDLEPSLGAAENHRPSSTWTPRGWRFGSGSQVDWAAGGDCDEREEASEDEGAAEGF